MKKKLLIGFLAVGLFVVMALPTQGAKYTLTSLGDQLAKIIKQVKNLKTNGTIPAKYVTYDRSVSGLNARTAQGAIDELGVKLSKLVSGTSLKSAGYRSAALSATTWTGNIKSVCTATSDLTTTSLTVTFTPITETTGTWTSSQYDAFNVRDVCDSSYPSNLKGTWSGSYYAIGNSIVANKVKSPDNSANPGSPESIDVLSITGNTISYVDNVSTLHNAVVELTRQ